MTLKEKVLKGVLTIIPLFALISTASMWVDTRYMHKEVSDIRYIEIQIRVIENQLRDYSRLVSAGQELTTEEQIRYDMDVEQYKNLMKERNKVLGIGDSE